MKKIFVMALLIILSMTVIGCDNLFGTTVDTQTTTQTNTQLQRTITVSDEDVLLSEQGSYQIVYNLNFTLEENEVITYTSSNELIATVSNSGKITGIASGECVITIIYSEDIQTTIDVVVSNNFEVVAPAKTTYSINENLNLTGATIKILDDLNNVITTEPVTNDMITQFDNTVSGSQMVSFEFQGTTYRFEILILDETQSLSQFNDCIVLNQQLNVGERIDLALTKSNTLEFLEVVNPYDYQEINIYGLFESPSGETKKVFAFWYQDYDQTFRETTIITSFNTEGKVNDTDRDYDYQVGFDEAGLAHYRFRMTPEEIGLYDATIFVEVDGVIIQTFDKTFTVSEAIDDDFLGYLEVDQTNTRNFVFENGQTYIPVGQNVAWYTSTQRMDLDYKSWFEQMGEVGMNYARVWMAPWGYSVFWDDLYNYDSRQDRMYSLDKTLEYADEADIYIQLCLLNHGMFSAEVNPMWPNDENNWYISRYGANPYADVIDNSGLFFSKTDMKELFENQLTYIIARYGYSDTIMSFELFNEVDWIETYSALYGNQWHSQMAAFIKSIDPNEHLITTSQVTESFYSSNYQVFNDVNIDFISIHRYGIYNHTEYLPDHQNACYEIFNKPVLYDEVGYQGWGGEQQVEADPNNITLHQELWAGALGGGAGTAMNWWWESWIDQYDFYDLYKGVATFTKDMQLSGEDFEFVTSEINSLDNLTTSDSSIGYMGYIVDDRVYLYVYDVNYALNYTNVPTKTNETITITGIENGTYTYQAYNTITGEIVFETTGTVTNGSMDVPLPTFNEDIAIKIIKQ